MSKPAHTQYQTLFYGESISVAAVIYIYTRRDDVHNNIITITIMMMIITFDDNMLCNVRIGINDVCIMYIVYVHCTYINIYNLYTVQSVKARFYFIIGRLYTVQCNLPVRWSGAAAGIMFRHHYGCIAHKDDSARSAI